LVVLYGQFMMHGQRNSKLHYRIVFKAWVLFRRVTGKNLTALKDVQLLSQESDIHMGLLRKTNQDLVTTANTSD